jgi:hypothetical protein
MKLLYDDWQLMPVNKRVHTGTNVCNVKTRNYDKVIYCCKSWCWFHIKFNASYSKQGKKHFKTSFLKAVRFVCFGFMFVALHILLAKVLDLLYVKYKCLSQHNTHSDEQVLHVDDAKYDWRCSFNGLNVLWTTESCSENKQNYS